MVKPRSLGTRLVLRVLALTVVLVLTVVGALIHTLQTSVDTLRDRSVQDQAFDIARHLRPTPEGALRLDLPATLKADYQSELGAMNYAVVDATGAVLFASRGVTAPLTGEMSSREAGLYHATHNGTEFFGYSLPWRFGARDIWIQVEQSTDHDDVLAEAVILELVGDSGWVVGLFTLALLFLIYLTIRGTLAPVHEISRRAGEIGPGKLDARLPLADVPSEIVPLVRAVNGALDRIADGFRTQREFTANAAHELKTPLAVLRAYIESAGLDSEHGKLVEDIDHMSRVVNQLLRIAELESGNVRSLGPVDLHQVAVDVATFIAPIAIERQKAIKIVGDVPNMVTGEAVLLNHAVRNLVENALEHTPRGTTVTIDVSEAGRLAVRDHGPGVPERYREKIFQRFWRAPDQRTGTGAGLGLSIVEAVVSMHGGTLRLREKAPGGACFEIDLRVASDATDK